MAARAKNKDSKKPQVTESESVEAKMIGSEATRLNSRLQRALGLIEKGDYEGAANLLAAAGRDSQTLNTLGVCLLRLGKVDQAVSVFRSFVLMPGTVLERPDVSNALKRNFATALLMKGFPSGALSVLADIREPNHLMAVRLRAAIKHWEKTLSWFRWLDWKLNRIEPSNCKIPLDFEPGEFDFAVQVGLSNQPDGPRSPSSQIAA